MLYSYGVTADMPTDVPFAVRNILTAMARDTYELQELWWYTLALCMVERERISFQESAFDGVRTWLWFRTVLGETFPLPAPSVSEQTERTLHTAAHMLLGENEPVDV